MKKILLFLAFVAVSNFTFAQSSFSDDFESYSAGDMISASSMTWDTWDGSAAIDMPVSADQAASGTNSLLVRPANASANGPADVVLPFGGKHAFGDFHFEMMMYVETGAYFNFQGETTPGEEWTFQPTFGADGMVSINNSEDAAVTRVAYPQREWFKLEVDVDLTLNNWFVSINGDRVANFPNVNNTIASLNLYPLAGHSYYIDDIAFEHTPFNPQGTDLGVAGAVIPPRGLNGKAYAVGATVINVGVTPVTSFDLSWSDGAHAGLTSVTGVNINSLQNYTVDFADKYTADANNSEIVFTVSNVNGASDDNADNNAKAVTMNVITPAPDKAIFVEEGTGTWCGWCPRGAVGMEYMAHEYPDYFVGVAAHNGTNDPMVVAEHNAGVTAFPGFTGFPGGIVERDIVTNPAASSLESSFFDYITQAPVAAIKSVVDYEGDTRTVNIEVQTTAKQDVTGDYKLLLIVREDGVTGEGPGWGQVNYYAGGDRGPMGGYELLPATVPGDQMVYNEVSRALLTPFAGETGSLPSTMTAGETYNYTASYVVPMDQQVTQLSVVAVILAPDGKANNAKLTKHDDWQTKASDVENVDNVAAFRGISPNPATDFTYIDLNLETAQEVELQILNSVGQSLSIRNYGQLTGAQNLPINVASLANGMYFAKIRIGDQFITRAISVAK